MISAYAGFGLALAAGLDYFIRLVAHRPTFTTRYHDIATLFGAAIAVVSVALADGEPLWAAVAAVIVSLQWFILTRWMLRMPPEALRVKPGDALPSFTVHRTDGTPLTSADLAAASPAVLVLYRGKW